MADISDVELAAVNMLISTFYPSGPAGPGIVGSTCKIYRGWPQPAALNTDLANGIVNITVHPGTGPDEILPAYLEESILAAPACTLTASVAGDTVTFTGTASPGQVAGILVDGIPYVYPVAAGDTTQQIAASLNLMIQANRPALCKDSSVRVPGTYRLTARTAAQASALRSLRRQKKPLNINCWCPSAAVRDTVAKFIDTSLGNRRSITLPDTTGVYLEYVSTEIFDQSQSAFLFRRDLNYAAHYILTATEDLPVMLFGVVNNGATPSAI